MGPDAIIVGIVIIGALVLFITEWLSVDIVAILAMSALVITGVISPTEGVAGFSNPATITVAAMFVISAALFKTGAVNLLGPPMARLIRRNYLLGLFFLMVTVAIISAFINSTPVVAIFIPIVVKAAKEAKVSVSKLLIPLSFASIFGGTCTVIGTSTNILVSGIADEHGLGEFGMFQLTPVGIIIFSIGLVYMMVLGHRFLPTRDASRAMSRRFSIRNYLADIVILKDSPNVGKRIMDAPLVKELDLEVLEVRRDGNKFNLPPADFIFEENDELRVRCDLDKIKRLKDRAKISIKATGTESEEEASQDTTILELIITANSELEGKNLEEVEFKRKYRAIPLAIQHRNEILHEQLEDINLKAGDIILAEVKTHRLPKFKRLQSRQESPFIIISEEGLTEFKPFNFWIVVTCVLGVVTLAATNVLSIMMGAIVASGILVVTKTITMKDTYSSIDWTVIFLLGGALSLGKGMENSGLALTIAEGLVSTLGAWGPHIILAGFYLITIVFTEIMSNNATAALMAPIAIVTAHSLGVSPIPFLMAVTFAASASFLTPVGYQTNTMIYGAGQYRFSDFGRTGAILSFVLWIVISWVIPYFFPF